MADTPSITIIKRFPYRGLQEEYSNTYHFTGDTPSNEAGWKTLADAVIASEKTMFKSDHQFVRAYGYQAGNEHSVATIDYVALGGTLVTGSLTPGSGESPIFGDAAIVLRGLRAGKNSKGRNTYCFKYFHGVFNTGNDNVNTTQKAAVLAHGQKMIAGTLPGGARWCAPQAQEILNVSVMPYITTRTLKRRGKRPSS